MRDLLSAGRLNIILSVLNLAEIGTQEVVRRMHQLPSITEDSCVRVPHHWAGVGLFAPE
jgi:hypothetical protein